MPRTTIAYRRSCRGRPRSTETTTSRPRFGKPPANLAQQHLHVAHRFPDFSLTRERGEAVWRGTLQPRPTSPAYRVVIRYKPGDIPKVWVTWPELAPKPPHRYADGSLCLYWPTEWLWRRSELIAETILPWTALWLYYYELWLECGRWLGPSSHDRSRKGEQTPNA